MFWNKSCIACGIGYQQRCQSSGNFLISWFFSQMLHVRKYRQRWIFRKFATISGFFDNSDWHLCIKPNSLTHSNIVRNVTCIRYILNSASSTCLKSFVETKRWFEYPFAIVYFWFTTVCKQWAVLYILCECSLFYQDL